MDHKFPEVVIFQDMEFRVRKFQVFTQSYIVWAKPRIKVGLSQSKAHINFSVP